MSLQLSSENNVSDIGPLMYSGSVKNIFSSLTDCEKLYFQYSDAYSVFDWGRMPDLLQNKGRSLLSMAHTFFSLVENPQSWQRLYQQYPELMTRFPQTLQKLIDGGLIHHACFKNDKAVDFLTVDRVTVQRPSFDSDTGRYHYYPEGMANNRRVLIPLEVIFRWGTPAGSSLLKRTDNPEIRRQLGEVTIAPNVMFDRPLLEFSTKLEKEDRLLTMDEAHWISGLKQTQWTQFNDTAYLCAYLLKDFFAQTGIVLWDGKCEFASYYQQDGSWQLVLVDSIGPDELRLTRQGQLLSKEVLRDFYRHSEWYIELERAKVQARNEHVQDWKKLCALTPVPLPRTLKENAEAIYSDLARELKESLQRYQAQELL